MKFLILLLCTVLVALVIFRYNKTEKTPIAQGKIIVIDGASSSGKSSVTKQLSSMMDVSYQLVAVDDFVTNIFIEQQKIKFPEKEFFEKEFFAKIDKQTNIMYDKIKATVVGGANVILDTVLSGLKGEESVKEQLEKLKGLKTFMVLVHCPLSVLIERINKQNELAKKENKPGDERSIATALSQFGNIYRAKTLSDEAHLGVISRSEVETACEVAKKEWGKNVDRYDQFKNWIFMQLDLKEKKTIELTTKIKYDLIVDTSSHSQRECAQKIFNVVS